MYSAILYRSSAVFHWDYCEKAELHLIENCTQNVEVLPHNSIITPKLIHVQNLFIFQGQ